MVCGICIIHLSDGDAKTLTRLNELAPYGKSIFIEKEECINNVQNQMCKGLRELATTEKLGEKLDEAHLQFLKYISCRNVIEEQ